MRTSNTRYRIRVKSAALLVVSLLITAATGGAATIVGTSGSDTLRGTPRADKLVGKAGNDRLHGLAGNDTLAGGPGNDLLVGGPGADRLACGAGRDTARGDALDVAGKDCEVVTGIPKPVPPAPPPAAPPPSPPAPPPPVAVTPGAYKGQINQGNFLFFDVLQDRTVSSWRTNEIPEECDSGGILRGGFWAVYPTPVRVADDGSFLIDWHSSIAVEGLDGPAKFHVRITGRLEGSAASGTVRSSSEFTVDGERFKCASAELPWAATRTP